MEKAPMGMYKYCDENLYASLRARLDLLEHEVAPYAAMRRFWINRREDDYWGLPLGVNINYHMTKIAGNLIDGNIWIGFIDEPNVMPMFSLCVLKALDVGGRSYFLRRVLLDRISIDALESAIVEHWNAAFALWDSWSLDDLLKGERVR